MTWTAAGDARFDHYELWYGIEQTEVAGRTGAAVEWDDNNDAALKNASTATTAITGMNEGYWWFGIWAVDSTGNEAALAPIRRKIDVTPPDNSQQNHFRFTVDIRCHPPDIEYSFPYPNSTQQNHRQTADDTYLS